MSQVAKACSSVSVLGFDISALARTVGCVVIELLFSIRVILGVGFFRLRKEACIALGMRRFSDGFGKKALELGHATWVGLQGGEQREPIVSKVRRLHEQFCHAVEIRHTQGDAEFRVGGRRAFLEEECCSKGLRPGLFPGIDFRNQGVFSDSFFGLGLGFIVVAFEGSRPQAVTVPKRMPLVALSTRAGVGSAASRAEGSRGHSARVELNFGKVPATSHWILLDQFDGVELLTLGKRGEGQKEAPVTGAQKKTRMLH